jgi:hypothetical protein
MTGLDPTAEAGGSLTDTIMAMFAPGAAPSPFTPKPAAIVRADKDVEPPEARAANVKKWLKKIELAERHHEPAFKRMAEDMDFAFGKQYPDATDKDDRYKLNIVHRHIQTRVPALYARQPTFIAKRRARQDFLIWDEEPASLQAAMQEAAMAMQSMQMGGPAMPPSPMTVALLQDVVDGFAHRKMMGKLGRTLEILFKYFIDEQIPGFKEGMKQMVRRVVTCGVGYVRLDFQRLMQRNPDTESKIADLAQRLGRVERLQADIAEGKIQPDTAEVEEMQQTKKALEAEEEVVIREGLRWHWPRATAIIPDTACTNLKTWAGADWIAERYLLTVNEIKEVYKVDVTGSFTAYSPKGELVGGWKVDADVDGQDTGEQHCKVYRVEQKSTGLEFTLCVGYKDYLRAPAEPNVQLERFFTVYALTFNDVEHEKEIFPPSDVRLLRSPQQEYNRTMEARRQHRIASRPLYAAPASAFEEEDQNSMLEHQAHEIILLKGLTPGQSVADMLQPVQKHPIDPNFYETETVFQDAQRAVGSGASEMGSMTGDGGATEASIAESGRISSLSSNTDDLDELLSQLARDGGQVLVTEMSLPKVQEIAGPGAAWPTMTRAEAAKEIGLIVRGGSSGRPNKERDIANIERLMPFIVQVPGFQAMWIAKLLISLIDDPATGDVAEALKDGMASIVAQNRMATAAPADAAADPNAQGDEGGDQGARPDGTPPGAQPAYPGSPGGPDGGAPSAA